MATQKATRAVLSTFCEEHAAAAAAAAVEKVSAC